MATPGDVVLVQYNLPGPIVYHERLILCVCPNGDYGVLDPDLDTYSEDYSATNATLEGVTPSIGSGTLRQVCFRGAFMASTFLCRPQMR